MTDETVTPVSAAEFHSALARLGSPRRYIVAVSGGPDSMALTRLAADAAMSGERKLVAVTVDHGLRSGSRAEAEQVGAWCRTVGLDHHILAWRGEKPASGVQAAARRARYRLLASFAACERYSAILTGHTADDQAETVLMRLARGAGPRGLAGMEAASLIAAGADEPVALLRPLLEFSRDRIIKTLRAFRQDYVADPSNDDPGFERIRTRALLAALSEQALLTHEALRRTASRMREASLRIEAMENAYFAEADGEFSPHGWASLKVRELQSLPPGLAARLIHAVSGGEYPPPENAAAEALGKAAESGAATLGGAIVKRARGRLYFYREPAALLGRAGVNPLCPQPLPGNERILWDRRFIVVNEGGEPLSIVPLGVSAPESGEEAAGAPVEALRGVPALAGALNRPAAGAPGVVVRSLAEERFLARLMRFS